MNKYCPYNLCDGSGLIEIDPADPIEARKPQYTTCKCVEEKAKYLEDVAYDDYEEK